jgi:hypothetical protein
MTIISATGGSSSSSDSSVDTEAVIFRDVLQVFGILQITGNGIVEVSPSTTTMHVSTIMASSTLEVT